MTRQHSAATVCKQTLTSTFSGLRNGGNQFAESLLTSSQAKCHVQNCKFVAASDCFLSILVVFTLTWVQTSVVSGSNVSNNPTCHLGHLSKSYSWHVKFQCFEAKFMKTCLQLKKVLGTLAVALRLQNWLSFYVFLEPAKLLLPFQSRTSDHHLSKKKTIPP